MIANVAFLAAVTLFLIGAWLAGALVFLAPYKATLFRNHGWFMGGVAVVLYTGVLRSSRSTSYAGCRSGGPLRPDHRDFTRLIEPLSSNGISSKASTFSNGATFTSSPARRWRR